MKARLEWVNNRDLFYKMAERADRKTWNHLRVQLDRFVKKSKLAEHRSAGSGVGGWAPNAPSTIRHKGHSRPLASKRLYQFGTLSRSYRVEFDRRDGAFVMENTALRNGLVSYPSILHYGARRIPARKHILWLDEEIDEAASIILDWVFENKRRLG